MEQQDFWKPKWPFPAPWVQFVPSAIKATRKQWKRLEQSPYCFHGPRLDLFYIGRAAIGADLQNCVGAERGNNLRCTDGFIGKNLEHRTINEDVKFQLLSTVGK